MGRCFEYLENCYSYNFNIFKNMQCLHIQNYIILLGPKDIPENLKTKLMITKLFGREMLKLKNYSKNWARY